jgi:hypothetical protein
MLCLDQTFWINYYEILELLPYTQLNGYLDGSLKLSLPFTWISSRVF